MTAANDSTVYVVGNTYPHRALCKAAGLRWDRGLKAWTGTREQAEQAVGGVDGVDIRGVAQVGRVRSDAAEQRAAAGETAAHYDYVMAKTLERAKQAEAKRQERIARSASYI